MDLKTNIKNFFRSPKKYYVSGLSKKGLRKENQDNILIIKKENNKNIACFYKDFDKTQKEIIDWPEEYVRVAVLDGMGGHEKGHEISELAVNLLMELKPQSKPELIRESLFEIHQTLQNKFFNENLKHPGTTLTMADINLITSRAFIANIGDSRAYLIDNNRWRKLTKDHNVTEFCYRDGEIDKEDYEPQEDISSVQLVQALGYGSQGIISDQTGFKPVRFSKQIRLDIEKDLPHNLSNHADIFSIKLKKNMVLLLATDGLWCSESGGEWRIIDDFNFFNDAPEKLIDHALSNGSDDNISVVIFGFCKT